MIKNIFSRASNKSQKGQGMTEYLIMVGVIAIGALGVFGLVGEIVEENVAGVATELTGQDAAARVTAAGTAVTNATTLATATGQNTLGNYNAQGQFE